MATVQMPDGELVELPDDPNDDEKDRIRQVIAASRAPSAPAASPEIAPPEIKPSGYVGRGEFAPEAGAESAPIVTSQAEDPLAKVSRGVFGAVGAMIPKSLGEAMQMLTLPRVSNVDEQMQESEALGEAWRGEHGLEEQAKAITGSALQAAPLIHLPFAESPLRATPRDLSLVNAFRTLTEKPESPTPLSDAATKEVTDATQERKIATSIQPKRVGDGEGGAPAGPSISGGLPAETPVLPLEAREPVAPSGGGEGQQVAPTEVATETGARPVSETKPATEHQNLPLADRQLRTNSLPPKPVSAEERPTIQENQPIAEVKSLVNPETGAFTRGGDYVRSVLDKSNSNDLIEFMRWARSGESTPYVARFGTDYAADILRQRGVPVDEIEWQQKNLPKQSLLSFAEQGEAGSKPVPKWRPAFKSGTEIITDPDATIHAQILETHPKVPSNAEVGFLDRDGKFVLKDEGENMPAVEAGAPPASPKLLPGETQGDLLSSTQQEPLALVGEKGVDYGAIQKAKEKATADRAESEKGQTTFEDLGAQLTKEEEARLKDEYEKGLLSDLEEHQQQGGREILDAVKALGGLHLDEPHFNDLKEAFQKKAGFSKLASGEEGYRYKDIFKKNAPGADALVQALRQEGFDVEDPGHLADILDTRFKTGKKVYGIEARSQEGGISGLEGYALGAAGKAEIPEPRVTGMKNRIVDEERVKRGLEPLMSEARKGNERTWNEAMNRIEEGEKLGQDVGSQMVDDINNRNKTEINETDQAVLLHERIRVGNERDMAADRINDPNTSASDKVQARNDWAAAEDRLNQTELALRASGTVAGRSLQIRQMMARDDYTYAGIERRTRAAQDGAPLSEEQVGKIKELSDRITELEKKLSERESTATETEHQQAFDTELTGLKKRARSERGERDALSPEEQRQKLVQAISERAIEGDPPEDVGHLVHQLALNFVREGITEREPLIDAVHGVIGPMFDINRHITRDLISGYGKFKSLDPEVAKAQLRQLKGEMQQVSKIEDMAGGEAPKKTGIERRTPSDEERRLIRQVNEMKKKGGFEVTDPARQLKSALDTIKTRLTNQIRDLHTALATRKPIEVKKGGVPYDVEANRLKGMRDALKSQYDQIFSGKGLTDEQRLSIAESAAQRSLKDWDERLADAKQGKFEGAPSRQPITSTKIDAIRAQRNALKSEVEALQKVSPTFQALKEQKALALRKARLSQRIADLQDKIDRGDFTRQPKRVAPEDAKTVELQGQVAQLKNTVEKGIAKAEFDNQPWIIRQLQHVAGVARASALSGYHTLGKLFGFSVGHVIEKPFTELAGAVVERVPGFKAIAEKADIYKGGHVQALATYYRTLFTKGIKEAGEYLKTGTTGEEARYGKPYRTPTHWYDYIGTIHGAEKTPITTAAREMYRQRAIENAIKNGQNPSDPIVRAMINQKTFEYANWEKLQENNKFAEQINEGLRRLEAVDPKTGRASLEKATLSSIIQTFFTKGIIKTPANFAKQLLVDYSPVGLARGTAKAVAAHVRGIDKLTPHEANGIIRLMQVGAIGTAMTAWGMIDATRDPKNRIFGGFYQPGQKRDENDVPWGSTRIGNQTFHVLAHSMLTEPAQFGSTIVRVARTLRSKSSGETKGALEGIVSAALYPLENAPVANPLTRTERYVQQGQTRKVVSDIIRGLIPQLIQNIAEDTDMLKEPQHRTPKTLPQDIEMGIPVLRQQVPTKQESSGGGVKVKP